jgi:hypothetical protein
MNVWYFSMARLVAAVLAIAALTHPAAGQAQEDPVPLTGVVVDAVTGTPVGGAAVVLIDRARPVLSDQSGRFTFAEVRPGSTTLIVTQLGYDTLRTEVEVGSEPITLRLSADPVVLERVTAMVDRFEARRNATGSSVRAFDRLGLQTASAFSVLEFLQMRTNLIPVRCPSPVAISPCAYVRGRRTEVQVYLDGARLVGGLDVLAAVRPEELYTLEVIGGGRSVRAYTTWFMETIAKGRRVPAGYLF